MLEKGQKVYLVKKRVIFEFIVELSNQTHAIVYDAAESELDNILERPHYQKVPIKNLHLTKESAKASRFEEFKKGDLVVIVDGWSSLKQGIVVDVNKLYVKVLTNTKVRRISKANILKLTEV
jgi:hypothetical protein